VISGGKRTSSPNLAYLAGRRTSTSAQEGAMFLGMAVFKSWRNPLSHMPGGSDRQPALEGLAAASAFARAIETATVVSE